MELIRELIPLQSAVQAWRRRNQCIALVPTMGNLHEGHLSLVREAKRIAERVVVSLFVNPLQFGPAEDFSAYPRTLAADREALITEGVDLLFAPAVQTLYPNGQAEQTLVVVPPSLSEILCGASRPGHFTGVATVVCKLFHLVQPDIALFGEKDFQQLLVIQRMVADLNLPVIIQGMPTVREPDGLALSSRNAYLTEAERAIAPELYRTLLRSIDRFQQGDSLPSVERKALAELEALGFQPDYVQIRRQQDLGRPKPDDNALIILGAARLGKARLIDNQCFLRAE